MQERVDPQRFRNALGTFTTGVTIVTAVDPTGKDVGVTANSFSSVSLAPPMVLWSLGKSSSNMNAFLAARHFAVHILAHDQDALALRFSQKGVDRFAGLVTGRSIDGIALLEGCTARFECHTAFQYEGGDHIIFVGKVIDFEHSDCEPLVFERGRFALAVRKGESLAAAPCPRSFCGVSITERVMRRLTESGLVEIDAAAGSESRLRLTAAGRRQLIELLAIAQAGATDAEKALNPGESRVLRQLLTTIIQATDPGVAHPWQP
jgi:3-hydroxy-9,10-secoandrosta-1,3,5(10)-triene-9,17-dione monooxygenase reductase component